MPTSHPSQINEILEAVIKTKPKSVIDIGVGFGKYGVLCREYLEFWDGDQNYKNWKYQIDGVEVFENYLTPLHSYIYDKIYIGEATEILPKINHKYDLLLLIDVIEHFTEEKGLELLSLCFKISRNVIISTPKEMAAQGDAFENPHETHIFQWSPDHFLAYPQSERLDIENDSLIFYIGEDVRIIRLSNREKFKRRWPIIYKYIKRFKNALKKKSQIYFMKK